MPAGERADVRSKEPEREDRLDRLNIVNEGERGNKREKDRAR
jgi:hypothetical protein